MFLTHIPNDYSTSHKTATQLFEYRVRQKYEHSTWCYQKDNSQKQKYRDEAEDYRNTSPAQNFAVLVTFYVSFGYISGDA